MTAITQITSNALHAASSALPKATAQVVAVPVQALEQVAAQAVPIAEVTQPLSERIAGHIGKSLSSPLTPGKALLTLAAGIFAFFLIGPLALKFAARSAGFLIKSAVSCAKSLLNPQFLTNAAQKGLMFFATLETALPFIRPLLNGSPLSQRLAGLSSHVAQFGQHISENAPRIAQMAGRVAGAEAGSAVEMAGPQITGLLQRASQFLKRLAHNLPEVAQQTAKTA